MLPYALSLTSPFYIVDNVLVNTVNSAQQACIESARGIRMYRCTLLKWPLRGWMQLLSCCVKSLFYAGILVLCFPRHG